MLVGLCDVLVADRAVVIIDIPRCRVRDAHHTHRRQRIGGCPFLQGQRQASRGDDANQYKTPSFS